MKKVLIILMVVVMAFTISACDAGNKDAELVDVTTEQGINIKLPSDITLQTMNGVPYYANLETGDNVVFTVMETYEGLFDEFTEENVLALYQTNYSDTSLISFSNDTKINGKDALISKITTTTTDGNNVTIAFVMVITDSTTYISNFTYGTNDNNSSLANNIDTCIESITIN